MSGRFQTVHTLRGLAALGVVCYHFFYNNSNLHVGMLAIPASFGRLGVQMFFVISGFILPYSLWKSGYKTANFGRFVLKRVARLDPPYVAAIGAAIAIAYVSEAMPGFRGEPFKVTVMQLLLHLGYLNAFFGQNWVIGVFWTLAIEFQFYVTLGLAYPAISSPSRWLFWAATIACLTSQQLLPKINYLPYHWPLFLMGIVVFRAKVGLCKRWPAVIGVFSLTIYAFLTLDATIGLAGAAAAFAIMFLDIQTRLTNFLGDISYSLYLIHQPIGNRICNLGARFARNPLEASIVAFVATIVSIGVAYLLYRWIEDPSKHLATRIKFSEQPKLTCASETIGAVQ